MDWQTLRNQFIRETNDTPGGALEDELIAAYAENPDAVERAVEKITISYRKGGIDSPWGVLRAEVRKAMDASRNPTHDRGASQAKAIQRAEQRIRNELLHYDRWPEAEDELFGDRGTMRTHDTPATRERLETLWHQLRPAGETVEREQVERLERISAQRAELAAATPTETPEQRLDRQRQLAAQKAGIGNLDVKETITT